MHKLQAELLELSKKVDLKSLTLRAIAEKLGNDKGSKSPQLIKHHLEQLVKKGFDVYKTVKSSDFLSIPLIGTADCGDASIFAEQNFQGFVKLSKSYPLNTRNPKNLFAIRAEGDSMNKAIVPGTSKVIESGDFVLVDKTQVNAKNGDVILAIIDSKATIKKFVDDRKKNNQIILMPESTQFFNPIFIHEDDSFSVNGKVVDVIKGYNK
jgi:SOS-response transcriptional repressor LexA